jgi:hypothetical protein
MVAVEINGGDQRDVWRYGGAGRDVWRGGDGRGGVAVLRRGGVAVLRGMRGRESDQVIRWGNGDLGFFFL